MCISFVGLKKLFSNWKQFYKSIIHSCRIICCVAMFLTLLKLNGVLLTCKVLVTGRFK